MVHKENRACTRGEISSGRPLSLHGHGDERWLTEVTSNTFGGVVSRVSSTLVTLTNWASHSPGFTAGNVQGEGLRGLRPPPPPTHTHFWAPQSIRWFFRRRLIFFRNVLILYDETVTNMTFAKFLMRLQERIYSLVIIEIAVAVICLSLLR